MPDLFKLLARNLIMGTIAGWITLAGLIATNVAGLYDVVFASSNPVLPIILLAFGFFITFGSLAMGAAVMMLPTSNDTGKGGGLKVHTLLASLQKMLPRFHSQHELAPVRVKDEPRNKPFRR